MSEQIHATQAEQSNEQEIVASQEEAIRTLRRYRQLKAEMEAERERGQELVRQVKEEVEADLAPLAEHLERMRTSLENFLKEHNAGEKFRAPGLGTVYTQSRLKVSIDDQESFEAALAELDGKQREAVYDRKFSLSRAKKLVQTAYEEAGQILPGCEVEHAESLCVKLSGS